MGPGFDFDGTIADTFEVVKEEGARILAPYRITMNVGQAKRIGLQQAILRSGFPVQDIPKRLTKLRQAIQARVIRDVKAFPEMGRIPEGLAQRFTLAVLSSNAEENIRGFCGHFFFASLVAQALVYRQAVNIDGHDLRFEDHGVVVKDHQIRVFARFQATEAIG